MDCGDGPVATTMLYVGDLDPSITDDDLMKTFTLQGQTPVSVRVCRGSNTSSTSSLSHAFVGFHSKEQAMEAMRGMNHKPLRGMPMRVMISQKEVIKGNLAAANVFVKNLDAEVDGKILEEMFCVYGQVVSCKVAMDNGRSKGFGFVQFGNEEEAQAAIAALHGSLTTGQKKLYVAKFMNKSERKATLQESKSCNLYIKNFGPEFTDEHLRKTFSSFGKVHSAVVMKDSEGNPKGFGFVNFKSIEEAKKALEAMNGKKLGSKHIYVGVAQRKEERRKFLMSKFQVERRLVTVVMQISGIIVAELDRSFNEKTLEEFFTVYGKVISVKLMHGENGKSKVFGIIQFSSTEEASNAMAVCHGNGAAIYSERGHTNPLQLLFANQGNGLGCFLPPRSLITNQQPPYMQQHHGIAPLPYQPTHVQSHADHPQVHHRMNLPLTPTSVYHFPVAYQMNHPAFRTNYMHGNANRKTVVQNNQFWEPRCEWSETVSYNGKNMTPKKYCEKPRMASKVPFQTFKPQIYVRKIKFDEGAKRKEMA